MNSTNRAANRLLLVLTGLLLIAAGAAGGALLALPDVAHGWSTRVQNAGAALPAWTGIAVAAGAVILIILLIVFIARQGRGHTDRLLERHGDTASTQLDLGVPRALLEEHLSDRPEFVSTRVSAYRVRGLRVKRTPMLKVSLQCRRGCDPRGRRATRARGARRAGRCARYPDSSARAAQRWIPQPNRQTFSRELKVFPAKSRNNRAFPARETPISLRKAHT